MFSFNIPLGCGKYTRHAGISWIYILVLWYLFFCSFLWPFHHSNQNIKSNIYSNSHLFWHYTSSPICMTHDSLLTLFKAEIVLAALDTAPLRFCMSPCPCTIPDSSDPQDLWGQGPPALLTAMLGSFVWNTKATAAELCFLHITPAAFHQLESYMYTYIINSFLCIFFQVSINSYNKIFIFGGKHQGFWKALSYIYLWYNR